jgi:hypothetical protein
MTSYEDLPQTISHTDLQKLPPNMHYYYHSECLHTKLSKARGNYRISQAAEQQQSLLAGFNAGKKFEEKEKIRKQVAAREAREALAGLSTTTDVPLPAGWSSAVDPSSGIVYYYNSQTGVTQWERPLSGGRSRRRNKTNKKNKNKK